MARTYETRDGDMIDLICFRFYQGLQSTAVEAVLEANRALGLSSYGPLLPRGLVLTLPDLAAGAAGGVRLQTLWD